MSHAYSFGTYSALFPQPDVTNKPEKVAWLALIPVLATCLFYLLPNSFQEQTVIQFLPQIIAYLGLAAWAGSNIQILERLGLMSNQLLPGLGWGCLTGLILGACNTTIILFVVPVMGGDIEYLRQTPHARVPTYIMVPWGILVIAIFVELNFRGFLLGRLIALFNQGHHRADGQEKINLSTQYPLAIGSSALVFTFDPFLVATFQHLHWIAIWDGCIWGWLWLRFRNLYISMTAHAVEVVIMYLSIKAVLT